MKKIIIFSIRLLFLTLPLSFLIFCYDNSVFAQYGSLSGSTTLRVGDGRPLTMAEGSALYRPAPRQKAYQLHDIVYVNVKKKWNYSNSATLTKTKKVESEARLTYWSKFKGLFKMPASAASSELPEIGGEIDHKTQNKGNLTQAETIEFIIACEVRDVLENGNLYIEGTISTQIGEEGKIMYVGGFIRPEDIAADHSISGDKVLNFKSTDIPSGQIYDTQRRAWGTRIIEQLKPL
ncbi:MAG: flagellar basal body L-ring protein FlgH [Planctomycetaceae bacterium]|jgi:flagellar L-ring protein precursor FlgH|nr:flagellar basal body L-ring protein FlgH [Planctomycetaceae bacterium]